MSHLQFRIGYVQPSGNGGGGVKGRLTCETRSADQFANPNAEKATNIARDGVRAISV
jgi:hypothetical protein